MLLFCPSASLIVAPVLLCCSVVCLFDLALPPASRTNSEWLFSTWKKIRARRSQQARSSNLVLVQIACRGSFPASSLLLKEALSRWRRHFYCSYLPPLVIVSPALLFSLGAPIIIQLLQEQAAQQVSMA